MPAYNEIESIQAVVEQWHKVVDLYSGNLLILNDGSQDQTLNTLLKMQERYPRLIIIDKPNSGHGQTCIDGYKWGIENKYKWLFQTDSDGQVETNEFENLWMEKNGRDFIFGFRPSRGDGFIRWIISKVLALILFCIFKVWVKDANVPYRLMAAEKLKPLLAKVPSDFFLANALLSVVLTKYDKILWVPITFGPRTGGAPSVPLKRFFLLGIKVTLEFMRTRI